MTSTVPQVAASFQPDYARYLGYRDGREFGSQDPHRSFNRAEQDDRTKAYYEGLAIGIAESNAVGLDTRCLVHWDKPGFNTPICGAPATHIGLAYYMAYEDGKPKGLNPTPGNVLNLCERHAKVQAGKSDWVIVPREWV